MSKASLKAGVLARLESELAAARAAHGAAMEGAVHDEARPENDKDTRGLEQSYLARGHAQRIAELEAALGQIAAWQPRAFRDEPVAIGALVRVAEGGRARALLIAIHGGGLVLPGDITVVTPTSPIGRALLGQVIDDECEIGSRTLTITGIE